MTADTQSLFSPTLRCARAILLVALATILAGCPAAGTRDSTDPQRLLRDGRYAAAAKAFEQRASLASGAERYALQLDATRAWLDAGRISRALATLKRIPPPLPVGDQAIELLHAYRSLSENAPAEALGQLAAVKPRLSPRYTNLWHELYGRALLMRGDVSGGVAALSERELWLSDGDAISANRELIWRALRELAQKGDPLLPTVDDDATTRGWLALGRAAEQGRRQPYIAGKLLRDWQTEYDQHPALFIASRMLAPLPEMVDYPEQVAVLLPLSGRVAGTSAAVRDGFMAGYLADTQAPQRPLLRFYDTEALGAEQAMRSALDDGAQFVIGPLRKDQVAEAATVSGGARVLALNYLPDDAETPANFYQFSLAPEHESAQVARRAVQQELYTAIALVPNNDWGERLLASFAATLEQYGGQLLDYRVYETSANDFGAPIRELLVLTESTERFRQVRAVTGLQLEFEPRRRQDVDFVFVGANPRQGRQIRPSFLYHYAEDLPVFATSAIYENNPDRNSRDLEGLIFADMPWVLKPDVTAQSTLTTIGQFWPQRVENLRRLYALGFDAYGLIPLLLSDEQPLLDVWQGATGELRMGAAGQIVRSLEMAQIRNGIAQPLPPIVDAGLLGDPALAPDDADDPVQPDQAPKSDGGSDNSGR